MIIQSPTLPAFLSKTKPLPPLSMWRQKASLNQVIFKNIHSNNLIYNTCWEDPRCDRALLELDADSRVVMITSAGCNALDYALDRPAEINCIDMNPRQNALLDLKIAAIQHTDAHNLFQLFGTGAHENAKDLYHSALRPHLPAFARQYWDKNVHFFIPKGLRKSFYWHSTSGIVAWFFNKYLKMRGQTHQIAEQLFAAETVVEQRDLYSQLERNMFSGFIKWLMSQHLFMCLLGVPESQQKMLLVGASPTSQIPNPTSTEGVSNVGFEMSDVGASPTSDILNPTYTEGGAVGFIQRSLRHVFTQLPIKDNYFWQLYFNGKYTEDCCPNYLKSENHAILKAETRKIHTHTATITNFLDRNPAKYSHYVLLDHQDWLAANDRPALLEEWQAILNNSRRGTRILLRSAADEVNFFPAFVHERVVFEKEKTAKMHQIDRVGTYGSVYLGIVK
jgi:S-adenosylmethionine-diacylglycerol 3-amino-3-carboxypropyl transferase